MDETGLQFNNKPGDVIAVKGSKCVSNISSAEKDYAYLTDSNGSQVENAVLPHILTTDTAIPGTSSGITYQEVVTPAKLLNEISPILVIMKQISARGKAVSVSKILNSDDNIGQRVEKSCSAKKETFHKPKRARNKKLESSDSSEDEYAAVYQESDDSTAWNDDECVGCREDCNDIASIADWLSVHVRYVYTRRQDVPAPSPPRRSPVYNNYYYQCTRSILNS
ncbi:hypothetical protein E2C01_042836 [Portunus trituberculatus]|uniref:Uncharacterized protein n=1 Tax=Portunus trituberculatus TaxID=210409 RepID=A0A5B7FU21_PORTR|nr:hypothetical protein [Portunus trituberculatus]